MKKKNILLNILLVICIATAGITGFLLFRYYHESHENEEFVGSLKDMIEEDEEEEEPSPSSDTVQAKTVKKEPATVVIDDETILKRYRKLYEKNSDFIGWIHIDDTNVDYPVMQCKEDEQKYMRKNFDGEYALAGTPFMAAECDAKKPSTNLIIYGHNMKDGAMFGKLDKYTDQQWMEEHKVIHFDTIYGLHEYEVIAAFHTILPLVGHESNYYFHGMVEAETQEELDEFLTEMRKQNEIQADTTVTLDDHLLMLSTCDDYGAHDGRRFLVIARAIKE